MVLGPTARERSASRSSVTLALASLAGSAVALLAAPALMPEGYSWVRMTTSESAAQGVSGAWLARLGFLLLGLSVIVVAATASRGRWPRWGTWLHLAFGVLMIAAAVFSNRPFLAGQPFDRTEDMLHSAASTGMGFAFALGVAIVGLSRRRAPAATRGLDIVGVIAPVVLPLSMSVWPDIDGVLQRLMFAIAFVWYAVEAARSSHE